MSALLVCGLAACGSRNGNDNTPSTQAVTEAATSAAAETSADAASLEESETAQAQTPTPGKTLVVYYSASGNTERVAGDIAAATGGDLFKLEPADPYTDDDLNWRDENSRVVSEHDNPDERKVELVETTVSDWESYDTVFIGYPIWWGIAAWPVDGFIAANDFMGKTVIPFCTSSSSGLGDSGQLLADAAGTGNWLEGVRFSSGVLAEEVQSWAEGLGLK